MNSVIIEFGSNIEPEKNIMNAKKLISADFNLIKESSLLKTKPVGVKEKQNDYINCAVMIETEMNCSEMKSYLDGLETRLGRKKDADKFAPRTIDLDIVVWNGKVIHKDFDEREYVRINVGEIMPGLI